MKRLTYAVSRFCLAIYLCIFSTLLVQAQSNCAADVVYEHLMRQPEFNSNRAILENKILSTKDQAVERRETAFIPVVVHIMHNGEPIGQDVNITEAQIVEGLNRANELWNDESGEGANMNVRFCLASIDPNGNPTSGITRTDASSIPGYRDRGVVLTYESNTNEEELKNLSNWPHDKYYNIWVVHKFSAGWGGYAYFPSSIDYDIDGTLIKYSGFSNNGNLLAHELGHGFNLFHTFNGANGSNCPQNSNCSTQGDRVCDTPPHRQSECSASACDGENFDMTFSNYMSYCSGLSLFTEGQKARVDATLENSSRTALLNSNACSATCSTIPDARFSHNVDGLMVSFSNESINSNKVTWDFGDGTSAVGFNQISHIYSEPKAYEVKLKVEDECGGVDYSSQMVDVSVLSQNSYINVESLTLSPNPNNGNFQLSLTGKSNSGRAEIQLIDVMGKHIAHKEVAFNGQLIEKFEMESLSSGIYFIQIQMDGALMETVPFIVH